MVVGRKDESEMNRRLSRLQVVLLIALVGSLLFPVIMQNEYYVYVATLVFINAIVAVSLNLLMGYTGLLSLAQPAFYGLGAYISALLIMKLGMPVWVAVVLTILISATFALLIGYPSLRFTSGIYFALVTFAFAEIMRLIVINWDWLTKGSQGLSVDYNLLPLAFQGSNKGYYYLSLTFLIISIVFVRIVLATKLGRSFVAIREDETLAKSMGVNVTKYKVISFVLGSVIASLAGAIYAPFIVYIQPEMMGMDLSVSLIGMVYVGGLGSSFGPVVGAIIFVGLPELLRFMGTARLIILGLLIVCSALIMRGGITGVLARYLSGKGRLSS